jgi:hypothetical protein
MAKPAQRAHAHASERRDLFHQEQITVGAVLLGLRIHVSPPSSPRPATLWRLSAAIGCARAAFADVGNIKPERVLCQIINKPWYCRNLVIYKP